MVLSLPPAACSGLVGLPNAGWLLLITNVALYLNYELFHYCCHVSNDRLVRHIPLVNSIRRHHIAHHDHGDHDGAELQPDLSDRRLVLRHVRPGLRAAEARLQRLRYADGAHGHPASAGRPPNEPSRASRPARPACIGGIVVGLASFVLWTAVARRPRRRHAALAGRRGRSSPPPSASGSEKPICSAIAKRGGKRDAVAKRIGGVAWRPRQTPMIYIVTGARFGRLRAGRPAD